MHVSSIVIGLLALGLPLSQAAAQGPQRSISVELDGARYVKLGQPIKRVSNANNGIAEVAAFPPDQLLVIGKQLGQTVATVWSERGAHTIRITVEYPVETITAALRRALPGASNLQVETAGSALLLSGEVVDAAQVERAVEVVHGFVPDRPSAGRASARAAPSLVNKLTVAGEQQVQLEVCFAEVSRTALRQIGVNFWHTGAKRMGGMLNPSTRLSEVAPGIPGQLQGGNLPAVQPPISGAFGLMFAVGGDAQFPFTAALSVLSSTGYARALAEPTLVALSGQEASFLAGGEFPIPLPQSLGQLSIVFKKFGVHLKFLPTVIGGAIRLQLETTVSDLDYSVGVKLASVTVPGLSARHSSTTIRLRDGQSFAIAGLLSDKVRSNVDKVPGLGDLPVLGALFRSTSYRREETELLVVVTARLVRPLDHRPLGPGWHERSDPSDLELFLFGSQESRRGGAPPRSRASKRGQRKGPVGPVGFARGGQR